MNLTDILLIIVIVLLLLLFVAVPVYNYVTRLRARKPLKTDRQPGEPAAERPSGQKPEHPDPDGYDLSGGSRVEEPAAALESGYRRVDPAQDLPSPPGQPAKKNGKPH